MKKNKKLILLIGIATILILFFILYIANYLKNDGMENTNEIGIYYKVYTEKDWSNWSKNGLTSGSNNKNNPIKNIKFKLKTKEDGYIVYNFYDKEKGWSQNLENENDYKVNSAITGIKVRITDLIDSKYNICYRTYNEENKWLEWSCNGEINGNINKNILAVQFKIIPKDVVRNEWLKDFEKKSQNESNIGF